MASAAAAAASSSFQRNYDVFISFRGEDTRNNFTAHLYQAMCQKGINTFMDDGKLEKGQAISPVLATAIENSLFSVVVLSKTYASSRWCLDELVKIVECMRGRGQRVFPIFYHLDPSDVRRLKGLIGEDLAKHEENSENAERVKSWKDALTQVADLSGWESRNKNEPLIIKEVVTHILNKLLSTSVGDTLNLIGIDTRIQEIEMRLCLDSDDVLMVGIWGMGGIGKTTLAKAVYKKITSQFEACSFFENVGEDLVKNGLIILQQKLMAQLLEEQNLNLRGLTSIKERFRSKKVLIILDNVDDPIILKCLIGNCDWFGRGSRIIITTRDKRLLISHGILNYYEHQRFDHDEALKFLSHYSLKHGLPRDDFMELSKEVISYAQGIPLALEVLGSSLFSMTKEEWRNQLLKLKSTPNTKIHEVLKVSFDGLDDEEKNIFLDVACFFKGEDKDYVMKILNGCGFHSLSGLRALIDKSLITISSNELKMHDLIQHMGREIVRQESIKELGKRSRLWSHEDISGVLRKNTATEKIEGLFLNLSDLEGVLHFNTQAFSRMNKLRLLKVYKSENITKTRENIPIKENCGVKFSKDFRFCYDGLSCLYLYGYSLQSLPSDFNPKNLVELSMPYSHIKRLWKGVKVLENLKFMDLRHSKYLTETPNFSGVANLERLVFEGCTSLIKVHSSLGYLKNLSFFNLKKCESLKSLPSSACNLKSLETLIISGCSKFEEFPENFGSLEMLKEIYANEISLRALPPSFSLLKNLKILSFSGCKGPPSTSWLLPRSCSSSLLQPISGLRSLILLDVSDCNLSYKIDLSSLGFLHSLEELYMGGNDILGLPSTIGELTKLQCLVLENCKRLQQLPQLPSSIWHVDAKNCPLLEDVSYQLLNSLPPTRRWRKCKFMGPPRDFYVNCLWSSDVAFQAFISGNRIPGWIRYQSPGNEVTVELPLNSLSYNFMGFALSFVFLPRSCGLAFLVAELKIFGAGFCNDALGLIDASLHLNRGFESDHMCLFYARIFPFLLIPLLPNSCWPSVITMKVTFKIDSFDGPIEVKRCGVGLVYGDEYWNHNNSPMLLSNSICTDPPDNSVVLLEEIHKEEPTDTKGSETDASEYHTADEDEPTTTTACSDDHSESEMRPQKRLKCKP